MTMTMISVNSSDISAIGYLNGTLHIKFHSGGLYSFNNVPENIHRSLMSASSHGKYFHTHIRGRYNDKRIG
jgi:hypothetical protein